MAFTRIQELEGFDTGSGGVNTGNPKYWEQDIEMLMNEEHPAQMVEKNILFRGQELTGYMSSTTKASTPTRIVLLKCPPFATPLEERFKYEP